jgi:hypothetical protein
LPDSSVRGRGRALGGPTDAALDAGRRCGPLAAIGVRPTIFRFCRSPGACALDRFWSCSLHTRTLVCQIRGGGVDRETSRLAQNTTHIAYIAAKPLVPPSTFVRVSSLLPVLTATIKSGPPGSGSGFQDEIGNRTSACSGGSAPSVEPSDSAANPKVAPARQEVCDHHVFQPHLSNAAVTGFMEQARCQQQWTCAAQEGLIPR